MATIEERMSDIERKVQALEWQTDDAMRIAELEQKVLDLENKPEEQEINPYLFSEAERQEVFLKSVIPWEQGKTYTSGQIVKHNGKVWRALPDVASFAPDETYDLDANPQTGGWAPIES